MKLDIDNCYRVLELEKSASAEQVKQAHRELAKVWHPDRFPNEPKLQQKGNEKLKEINGAYEILREFLEHAGEEKAKAKPTTKQAHTQRPSPPPPQPKRPHPSREARAQTKRPNEKSKEEFEKQRRQFQAEQEAEVFRQALAQKKKRVIIVSSFAAAAALAVIFVVAINHSVGANDKSFAHSIDVALSQSDKASIDAANEYKTSGREKEIKGDWSGAADDLKNAIAYNSDLAQELQPDFAQVYSGLGNAELATNDWSGAIADYNKAIEVNPENAKAYNNRGFAKAQKGDWDAALADCNRAVELKPDSANPYYTRGWVEKNKGDWNAALSDFKKTIELNPADVNAQNAIEYLKSQMSALAQRKSIMASKPAPNTVVTITNLEGKVYEGIKIVGDVPDGILFSHTNINIAGVGEIFFTNLPESWGIMYNYSNERAEGYEASLRASAAEGAVMYNPPSSPDIVTQPPIISNDRFGLTPADYYRLADSAAKRGDMDGWATNIDKANDLQETINVRNELLRTLDKTKTLENRDTAP